MKARLEKKYGSRISGEYFFNCDKEVQRLTELIDDGNDTLIVVPRRVVETSLFRETEKDKFRGLDKLEDVAQLTSRMM